MSQDVDALDAIKSSLFTEMCAWESISPVRLPIVSAINYGLAQGKHKYHTSTIISLATERDTK